VIEEPEAAGMKLGFVGTGALTGAIVSGLKSAADNSGSASWAIRLDGLRLKSPEMARI
jgi:hypothetical protein